MIDNVVSSMSHKVGCIFLLDYSLDGLDGLGGMVLVVLVALKDLITFTTFSFVVVYA